VLAFIYPRGIAYPLGVLAGWLAAAILYRGIELYRNARRRLRHRHTRNAAARQ
jgi:hypothetical protein